MKCPIGLLMMLAGASALLNNEGAARPAGGFAGPALPAVRAFPPASPRATFPRGFGGQRHGFRAPFFRHRHFGKGWPGFWGAWPSYEPYNYGSGCCEGYTGENGSLGYGAPYSEPPLPYPSAPTSYPTASYPAATTAPVAKQVIYILPYRPGCDTQTDTLPWRDGREHTVRIVRC